MEIIGGFFLFFILLYIVMVLISIVISVLATIALWKLFEKAGEKGWASLIPVYNYFVMVKIATGNYTLGWVYLVISLLYSVFMAMGSFMMEHESGDMTYIFVMLIAFAIAIPLYAIVGYVSYMFGKSYGKPTFWNVCMIFLSPILIIVMGFDKNTYYVGAKGISQNYT